MKTATILTVALLFALGATAAWAQCPPEPVAPAPVCPPAPRCAPTEMVAPAAQCPCPQANPAAWGAGPATDLAGLECQDFDKAYIEKMYNQNATIIALTTEGIQRATDRNLRNISGEIRTTKTNENVKLADLYAQMGYGAIPVNYDRAEAVVESLNAPMGKCFDVAYAETLSGLLKQSQNASGMVSQQGGYDQLARQANVSADKDSNYVFRLDRWVDENGQV